jgi:hypothetical protein
VKSILPLLIGQCDGVFDRSSFVQSLSEVPKIQVRALETKLRERLDNHCLGTPCAPLKLALLLTSRLHSAAATFLRPTRYDEKATVQDDHSVSRAQGGGAKGQSDVNRCRTVGKAAQGSRTAVIQGTLF